MLLNVLMGINFTCVMREHFPMITKTIRKDGTAITIKVKTIEIPKKKKLAGNITRQIFWHYFVKGCKVFQALSVMITKSEEKTAINILFRWQIEEMETGRDLQFFKTDFTLEICGRKVTKGTIGELSTWIERIEQMPSHDAVDEIVEDLREYIH